MTLAKEPDRRIFCAILAVIVLALGLLIRSRLVAVPAFPRKYGADALWALLVFLLLSIAMPKWTPLRVAIAAFAFSCAIEFSQLYHSPWLDWLRATFPGALVLGSVFNWPDLPAYAAGIGVGFLAINGYARRQARQSNPHSPTTPVSPESSHDSAYEAQLDLWWAIPGVVAGMPMPLLHPERREIGNAPRDAYNDDIPLLARAGIGAVVNLLDIPGDAAVYDAAGFGYHSMPIPDGFVPSAEQYADFLRFMAAQRQDGRAIAVHCAAGLGRTGTVLAGYLVSRGLPVEEAIARIRAARPGAIETTRQLRFLYELRNEPPGV
jgi:hypothetical protein